MEQSVATDMKSAMISVDAKEGSSSTRRVHPKLVLPNSSSNDNEMGRSSCAEIPQDKHKGEVKQEYISDKWENVEAVLVGKNSKKEMVKSKFTRIKSRTTKNLNINKMKKSCDSRSSAGTRTRKWTGIRESTNKTKQDSKEASVNMDYSTVPKRKCSANVILKENSSAIDLTAQKVVEAAVGSRKMLGVHVSVAGGLEQGFYNALSIGCRSFAFFVRNQRSWNSPPMKDEVVQAFRKTAQKLKFPMDQIVVHGSYLINGGSCDMEILDRARACMLDECKRCEQLGIIYYNIHPGSTAGKCTRDECIKTIAATLDYVMDHTEYITILIETMAGQGNTIGGKFEELQQIINLVKNKKRVGVCLDTCHIFAAGYDIRSEDRYKATITEFENTIGLQYLRAFHINDSSGDLGSRLDRHANIGKGKLKLAAFRHIIADPRFDGLPMILETPEGDYAGEMIRLYQSLNSKPLKEHKKDIRSFFSPI
ncbi:hypothetical protein LOAG_10727 [Loa loa]|uniref:AP_endonuc_2 domain-containing protein n=1 Tax=Loa loa TaxID=7209 RepID=A0A1I7VC81_LOALO|nr:hypothetical protein LOAG_10727 [Loa loa]EFO17772.1 hypothetical protein LOAG_10727 [Loa loa]